MREFYHAVKSEGYLFLHSKLLGLHIGVPLLGILLFCSYYAYAPWDDEDKILMYLQAITLAFPLLIAIIMGMSYDDEKEAAEFSRMLTAPYNRRVVHLAKLAMLIFMGMLAAFVAIVGFGMISNSMGNHALSMAGYFEMFGVVWVCHLCLYVCQYVVSFEFGKGSGLALGIFNTLMSALMYTGLGDRIWYFLPGAWGIRMVSYLTQYSVYHRVNALIKTEMIKGCGMIGLITIMSLVGFNLWASKWQGIRAQD